ncbi:unnamed protein product, partial [Didymodactylos carnosus]
YNALVICLLPYKMRKNGGSTTDLNDRDRALYCLKQAHIDNFKIGRTKLLFRYWHTDQLHHLSKQYERKVNVCQKVLRGWLTRRRYNRLREVHHLQLQYIKKFLNEVETIGSMYKTIVSTHVQYDKKRHDDLAHQQQHNKYNDNHPESSSVNKRVQQQSTVQQRIIGKENIQRPKMSYINGGVLNGNDDEDQVQKTLNYFDSILDQYLSDGDDENSKDHRSPNVNGNVTTIININSPPSYPKKHHDNEYRKSSLQRKTKSSSNQDVSVLHVKTLENLSSSYHTHNNDLDNANNSRNNSRRLSQHRVDMGASHFKEFHDIRYRFEQMTNDNSRRYTSENNLSDIGEMTSVASNNSRSRKDANNIKQPHMNYVDATKTTTTSTTDVPSWKKLSPQARLMALLDKTSSYEENNSISLVDGSVRRNRNNLLSQGNSASLIDLSSIDKSNSSFIQPFEQRPRFRFVPPAGENSILQEELEPSTNELQHTMTTTNNDHSRHDKRIQLVTTTPVTQVKDLNSNNNMRQINRPTTTYDNIIHHNTNNLPSSATYGLNSTTTYSSAPTARTFISEIMSPCVTPPHQNISNSNLISQSTSAQNGSHVNYTTNKNIVPLRIKSTLFSHQHENTNSAFKPHQSSPDSYHQQQVYPNQHEASIIRVVKPPQVTHNGLNNHRSSNEQQSHLRPTVSAHNVIQHPLLANGKIEQLSNRTSLQAVKRTESMHKPGVHVGITNPTQNANTNGLLTRQPNWHQSLLNLSTTDYNPNSSTTPPTAAVILSGSRGSLQSTKTAPNYTNHPAFVPKTTTNGQNSHISPQSQDNRQKIQQRKAIDDPLIQWIKQLNEHQPKQNGHVSQHSYPHAQQFYQPSSQAAPYSSSTHEPHITNGAGSTMLGNSDYSQQYLNNTNVNKQYPSQLHNPTHSYLSSPQQQLLRNHNLISYSENVYHFANNNNTNPQHLSSKVNPPIRNMPRNDLTVTTYL